MIKNSSLRKLLFTFTAASIAFMMNAQAQTINDAFAAISDSTGQQSNFFTVIVSDTSGISEIEIRLGNNPAASDLMLHSFVWDGSSASPYSYSRNKTILKLGFPGVTKTDIYYG